MWIASQAMILMAVYVLAWPLPGLKKRGLCYLEERLSSVSGSSAAMWPVAETEAPFALEERSVYTIVPLRLPTPGGRGVSRSWYHLNLLVCGMTQ